MDQGWKRTIDQGLEDPERHAWDAAVASAVSDYNRRLKATPGYVVVDPTTVAAILWVESNGPKRPEWHGKVMQFGNDGDLGLPALHDKNGLVPKVVSPDVLALVDAAWDDRKKLADPEINIRCGVAYLFTMMAIADAHSSIVGWRVFDAKHIAAAYNGGGDPRYAEKLQYVLDALQPKTDVAWSGGGAGGGGGGSW